MKPADLERHNLSEPLPSPREIRNLYNAFTLAESNKVTPTREDPWGKPLPIDNAPFNARSFVIATYGDIGYMGSLRKRRALIVDILCEPINEKREQLIAEARAITQQAIMEYGVLNELHTDQILSEIWTEERRILEEEVGIPTILLDSILNSAGGLKTYLGEFPEGYFAADEAKNTQDNGNSLVETEGRSVRLKLLGWVRNMLPQRNATA